MFWPLYLYLNLYLYLYLYLLSINWSSLLSLAISLPRSILSRAKQTSPRYGYAGHKSSSTVNPRNRLCWGSILLCFFVPQRNGYAGKRQMILRLLQKWQLFQLFAPPPSEKWRMFQLLTHPTFGSRSLLQFWTPTPLARSQKSILWLCRGYAGAML